MAAATWDLARYAEAARRLGRLAGRTHRNGLPGDAPPLFGGLRMLWAMRITNTLIPVLRDDATWRHPLMAAVDASDPALRDDLLALAGQVPSILDAFDRLPRGLAHGDACPQNLLPDPESRGDFVAIDWGFANLAPLGSDLVQLLAGRADDGELAADDLPPIQDTILAAYLDGLRDERVDTSPVPVHQAFLAGLVVGKAFSALPLERLGGPIDDRSVTSFQARGAMRATCSTCAPSCRPTRDRFKGLAGRTLLCGSQPQQPEVRSGTRTWPGTTPTGSEPWCVPSPTEWTPACSRSPAGVMCVLVQPVMHARLVAHAQVDGPSRTAGRPAQPAGDRRDRRSGTLGPVRGGLLGHGLVGRPGGAHRQRPPRGRCNGEALQREERRVVVHAPAVVVAPGLLAILHDRDARPRKHLEGLIEALACDGGRGIGRRVRGVRETEHVRDAPKGRYPARIITSARTSCGMATADRVMAAASSIAPAAFTQLRSGCWER